MMIVRRPLFVEVVWKRSEVQRVSGCELRVKKRSLRVDEKVNCEKKKKEKEQSKKYRKRKLRKSPTAKDHRHQEEQAIYARQFLRTTPLTNSYDIKTKKNGTKTRQPKVTQARHMWVWVGGQAKIGEQ
jgi:hypothetical protein